MIECNHTNKGDMNMKNFTNFDEEDFKREIERCETDIKNDIKTLDENHTTSAMFTLSISTHLVITRKRLEKLNVAYNKYLKEHKNS